MIGLTIIQHGNMILQKLNRLKPIDNGSPLLCFIQHAKTTDPARIGMQWRDIFTSHVKKWLKTTSAQPPCTLKQGNDQLMLMQR